MNGRVIMGVLCLESIKQQVCNAKDVYVSTVNADGYPVTRVMFNLHNPVSFPQQVGYLDGLEGEWCVYLGTNTSSAKVLHIRRDSHVSLYYHKPDSWDGLLIGGDAEVVEDMAVKSGLWQNGWEMYYTGGIESPDYAIIRVRPVFAEYYHDLGKEILRFG